MMTELEYKLLTFSTLSFLAFLYTSLKAYGGRGKKYQPRAKYQREK